LRLGRLRAVVAEVEIAEVGVRAVRDEVDRGLDAGVVHKRRPC
jgi:hypothetical protein